MAEFEESLDIIEEAEEGLDGATEEEAEMTEEEAEEFKEEIAEAKENVTEMASDAKEFSKFAKFTEAIKSFGLFLVKTAAIGSIFFGVNVLLSKLVKRAQGDKESNKKKRAVVNAITALIQSESGKSKKLLDWLKQHQDDTIELDGIPVPLEAIFHKYLGPISDATDQAFNAARRLQTKNNGKVSWEVPTAEDINYLLKASDAFIKALDDFQKFAAEKSLKFPVLKTLPLKQDSIDDLCAQLKAVKDMPFY